MSDQDVAELRQQRTNQRQRQINRDMEERLSNVERQLNDDAQVAPGARGANNDDAMQGWFAAANLTLIMAMAAYTYIRERNITIILDIMRTHLNNE